MRALVTGATGAIGPATVRALMASGLEVRALVRPAGGARPGARDLDAAVEVVAGDITDRAAIDRAVRGVDVVVHLAALLHIVNPDATLAPRYRDVNVEGTRHVVRAAADAGVRRVVLASTTAVYGPTGDMPATEATAPAPDTWYAETKLEAERVAREIARAGGPQAVVLRLSAVYGPRVKGNYRRLLGAIARGRFVAIGPGTNRRSLVSEHDAGRAFALAATHDAAAGGLFNVSDGTPHTIAAILGAMAAAVGRPTPRWRIPVGVARAAAGAIDLARGVIGQRSALRAAIDKYVEDAAVEATSVRDVLGFRPELDLAAGWAATAAALRQAGDLPPRAVVEPAWR